MRSITRQELEQHSTPGDSWMAINGDVYDVSKFAALHPGGTPIIEQYAGKDVSSEFHELHRKDVLRRYEKLRIGRLDGAQDLALQSASGILGTPFAEIPAFAGQNSPYYNESHKRFLLAVRRIIQQELEPIAEEHDLADEYPDEDLWSMLGKTGLMICRMGPGRWFNDVSTAGISIPGDVKPAEFDYFHELICHQEIGRIGRPGFIDSLGAGWLISAPAVYNFGTEEMRSVIGPKLLAGDVWSCLAISEPFAGSDVAGVRTTAQKTPDGKHYIVNGVKKWITEGMYSKYFVTAVRTGGPGNKGMSMLLIERGPGLETKQIKTTYSKCCGTALVIFNNCKVPVSNLMGNEGDGFKQVMYNFNHERWLIVNSLMGQARGALAETVMWAQQRKIFGKKLIDQPVIRNKLANAGSTLESTQAHIEAVTYDMLKTKGGAVGPRLACPIAMMKLRATRAAWTIADDCVQVFGGRAITATGMGGKVEGFKNYVKYAAVYGGSEEIMAELSLKQSLKDYPANAKL